MNRLGILCVYQSAVRRAFLILLGLSWLAAPASSRAAPLAVPPLPFTVYGQATLNGALYNGNMTILTNGVAFNTATATLDGVAGRYHFNVPGDDLSTLTIEGGVEVPGKETVYFAIPGYELAQTVPWRMGEMLQLDLSDSPFTYTLSYTFTAVSTAQVFLATDGGPGLEISSAASLGETSVSIRANQTCTTQATDTVLRCFDISPSGSGPHHAALTFYFFDDQLNGKDCLTLNVYHFSGGAWQTIVPDGRDCSGLRHWVSVSGVSSFSSFVLGDDRPNAIRLESLTARSAGPELDMGWDWLLERFSRWFLSRKR